MSDLQLALIALGAVIVASVILYNWWQERRLLRESSWRFEETVDDALMEQIRIDEDETDTLTESDRYIIEEPITATAAMDDEAAEALPPPAEFAAPSPAEVVEESLEPLAEESDPLEDMPAAAPAVEQHATLPEPDAGLGELPAAIDEHIDLVALLRFAAPLTVDAVYPPVQASFKPDKPMQCFVQDAAGAWHVLSEQGNGRYLSLACALQLADRTGPVSQTTLRQFQEGMQALAESLGAEVSWHGAANPLPYALELDQFCVDVDVMVGFHVTQGSNGSFAGTKLRGLAEAGGMQLNASGAFHFINEAGETLYTMVSQDQRPFRPETLRTLFYRGLSFQLDVPRVGNCNEAFSQMVQLARKLEASLGGQLVDDNQRVLGDGDIEKIRQQLKAIQTRMAARGILPGSATALRLFS